MDVVVLTRDGSPPPEAVRAAIAAQDGRGLSTKLHVVAGRKRAGDASRIEAIARARNAGKWVGSAPWLMFVDDDVVLGPGCVAALIRGLRQRPHYAALAADYRGESAKPVGADGVLRSTHVAMGATLFRREALALLEFRTDGRRCECHYCADDLRRAGLMIGYLPSASARHETGLRKNGDGASGHPDPAPSGHSPRVLTAFNRKHFALFRRQFLSTFRAAGNRETVVAVAYGLYPSEVGALEATPGVEVVALPDNDDLVVAARRLRDFQTVVARLPEDTPVAFWDAGDVLFQSQVAPLWDLVRADPGRLHTVREPAGHPENGAVAKWALSIADPEARRRAFELLSTNTYLNGGFAAAAARTMLQYLRGANQIRHSTAMRGSLNRGDQTAMNLYCHADPARWREVPWGWNYCLCHRKSGDFRIDQDGRYLASDGASIRVVHGNGGRLRNAAFAHMLADQVHRDEPSHPSPAPSPTKEARPTPSPSAPTAVIPGRILTAFDRKHLQLFKRRFLASLRRAGNAETVTAVVTGLYPSERRALALQEGVEVVVAPDDGHPARQRLRNFQHVIASWPEETPVAHWDAGDVVFQGRLGPLWAIARAHPDRLLTARSAERISEGSSARRWVESIKGPESRRRAIELLYSEPQLAAGFAAGTVRAFLRYLRGSDRLLRSHAMIGTTDWGDQTAMNLFCYSNRDAWVEISTDWNYIVRGPRDYRVNRDGNLEKPDGGFLPVVHGPGHSLRALDLVYITS